MKFISDLISIEEKRISALIVGFIITLIFSLFIYYEDKDISTNLLSILQTLIFGVIGVGGINVAESYIKQRDTYKTLIPEEKDNMKGD